MIDKLILFNCRLRWVMLNDWIDCNEICGEYGM